MIRKFFIIIILNLIPSVSFAWTSDLYGDWSSDSDFYWGNRLNNVTEINDDCIDNSYEFDGLPYHELVSGILTIHSPVGDHGITLSAQIRPYFTLISPSTSDYITFVWDAKYDPVEYNGGKSNQITSTNDGPKKFEYNPKMNIEAGGEPTWLMLPAFRIYNVAGRQSNYCLNDHISATIDGECSCQPGFGKWADYWTSGYSYATDHVTGSNPKAFLVKPGQWYRYYVTFDYSGTPSRVFVWAEAEDTPLTLIVAQSPGSSTGWELDFDTNDFRSWWIEMNSSETTNTNAFDTQFRNVFIVINHKGDELNGGSDTTPPELSSATINTGGDQITLLFNESCTGNAGFSISPSGGASTMTYSSGTGTNRIYDLSRTIAYDETVTISYSPGDVEDLASNAMETFSGTSVINNSVYGSSNEYWVDADAQAGCDGLSSATTPDGGGHCAFDTIADVNGLTLGAGYTIYLQKGDSWSETLTIGNDGESGSPITVTTYGTGNNPILYDLTIAGSWINVTNINIDHEKAANTCISINGHDVTLTGMEIKNGTRDGVDVTGSNITFTNCSIHHFLRGYYGADPVQDAHGIAIHDADTVLIDGCTIYNVSGDGVQADPTYGTTDNITVQNSEFYSAPLTEDFNGTCPNPDAPTTQGWCTGNEPGENGIDTKADLDVQTTWTLTNTLFHGYTDLSVFPDARAVLNLKHNIDVTVNRCAIYDNQIGIRLRGDPDNGNPQATIKNSILYDNSQRALWVADGDANSETTTDEIEYFYLFNNTFGSNTLFYDEDNITLFTDWDLRNNAFLGTKPARFSDSTNISGSSADFNNSANDDYTLSTVSSFINHGETISGVIVDYAGTSRVAPYEVGAYEFGGNVSNNITFNNCIIK